jgi:hypothetical protein
VLRGVEGLKKGVEWDVIGLWRGGGEWIGGEGWEGANDAGSSKVKCVFERAEKEGEEGGGVGNEGGVS